MVDEKISAMCETDGEVLVNRIEDGCPICGGVVTPM